MERIFNYRLSKAQRVVENTFGIISLTFKVLRKPLLLKLNKAQVIVMEIVCLHNYLRKSKTSQYIYTPNGSLDLVDQGNIKKGRWKKETQSSVSLILLSI